MTAHRQLSEDIPGSKTWEGKTTRQASQLQQYELVLLATVDAKDASVLLSGKIDESISAKSVATVPPFYISKIQDPGCVAT